MSCEDIKIVLEKSDDREFLFGIEACTDLKLLVRIVGVNRDLLVISSLFLVIHLLIGGLLI
jgi:hypothetical protein